MKRSIIVLGLACIGLPILSFAQLTQTRTATTAANSDRGASNPAWSTATAATGVPDGAGATVSVTGPGASGPASDYLYLSGFNFTIPGAATIQRIEVTVTRSRTGAHPTRDETISLVKTGLPVGSNKSTTTLYTNPGFGAETYGASTDPVPLWGTSWTESEIEAATFGVVIASRKASGPNAATSAAIDAVSVTVVFSSTLPILLQSFEVQPLTGNKVGVRWQTSSEENVRSFTIERSSDGVQYSDLETVAPRGSKDEGASYQIVDNQPHRGPNYYRLREEDIDGKVFHFQTRQIRVDGRPRSLTAYARGSSLRVQIEDQPGTYLLLVRDTRGAILQSRQVKLGTEAQTIDLPLGPHGEGIAIVSLTGWRTLESLRVFIPR